MILGDIKRRIIRAIQKVSQSPIVIKHGEEDPMPGAFIIAPFRSGTTLLRYIFDSHSKIAAPPETFLFVPLLSPLRDKRLINTMWNLGFHKDTLARSLGDCCRGFLEAYAKSKDKSFWMEKTPSYVSILPEIFEAFGEVKFLMLYRHPFDIVQSMMDRDMANIQPEIANYRPKCSSDFNTCCAYVANQRENMIRFQRKHPDVTIELRYENITTEPEREIMKACNFIRLDFEEEMLSFNSFPHDLGFEDEKIRKTKKIVTKPKRYEGWTSEEIEEALKFLQKDLTLLGYSI